MDDIIKLLTTDPRKAIEIMTASSKDSKILANLKKEHDELDRSQRNTQIGKVQKNKTVGEGDNSTFVEAVRTPIGLQNKIVQTSMAFEVGEAPSIIGDDENKLVDEILRVWKVNRIDSLLQKLLTLRKSQLQCAILFKITNIEKKSLLNRILGPNTVREIKTQVLENKNGKMSPYFDSTGDMKAFIWEFNTLNAEGKSTQNIWVYTDTEVYILDESKGTFGFTSKAKHGFSKIPVVYISQEFPEWHVAEKLIDRIEVVLSKLGASNDYCGHPILKMFGKVEGAPSKNDDGKAFIMKMVEDEETGKVSKQGDVEYLTYEQAPEAIKLEMDQLLKFIYSTTSTPDWSFENLKGMGNALSGKAFKMMLIDPIMKAKMNEGYNRTMIERMINVITSGILQTTVTAYSSFSEKTTFTINFNSIIPDDIEERIKAYKEAVDGKFMSRKTAIELLDQADAKEEMAEIEKESEVEPTNEPTPPAE